MKRKSMMIEALSIHKEICSYLIDKRISFKCYNGGLRAIIIEPSQPFARYDFMAEIAKEFNLYLERETSERFEYKQIV